ncbi:DUF4391 domain-containing protein [Seonamhaeicola sp. MEBiC1930]|uniref:DUF4391 domain-containing protein n=1 Tax=Seonamhaeicola sp. MEBiC01930 TaxID=2976768 RepID=UPI0032478327
MEFLNLPSRTKVNRFIPKNAFDKYTSTKQKKLFVEKVSKITWLNKLSEETVNLAAKEIKEIQIFRLELKKKEDIQELLEVIDKSIPYPIIFLVQYNEQLYFSCSSKHPHPINEDSSVIDWTFNSPWQKSNENNYLLNLRTSLDWVYKDFCVQLSGKEDLKKSSLEAIISHQKQVDIVEKDISKLKSAISRMKQFNKKVELNNELNEKKKELKKLKGV